MPYKNITWISFLVTLSTLTIPIKAIATQQNSDTSLESTTIENRLMKIAKTLKERENQLRESSDTQEFPNSPEDIDLASWLNGSRGTFINNRYGGGFGNRRYGGGWINGGRWRDRGGFLNRSPWRNGGGFVNRGGGWRNGGGFLNRSRRSR